MAISRWHMHRLGLVDFWCYDISYWKRICVRSYTNTSVRNASLDKIQNQELKEIASILSETSKFGYQEGLLDVYIDEIERDDEN